MCDIDIHKSFKIRNSGFVIFDWEHCTNNLYHLYNYFPCFVVVSSLTYLSTIQVGTFEIQQNSVWVQKNILSHPRALKVVEGRKTLLGASHVDYFLFLKCAETFHGVGGEGQIEIKNHLCKVEVKMGLSLAMIASDVSCINH